MNRREFGLALGGVALSGLVDPHRLEATIRADAPAVSPPARRWSFVADVAECCSCEIPCPCNFGRPAETCFGNRLIRIRSGEFEGADLAGISFLVTFHMGRWTRLYIPYSLTPDQAGTLDRFLPVGFAGFQRLARATERVPLTVTDGEGTFAFSVPDSSVEMKLLPGMDGAPIRIDGLPSNAFYDYVQYESVVHRHGSADGEWSYSGTNGFRSEMRAAG